MKLRVIYGSRLVKKGYKAWVLFPFMFFRNEQEEVSDTLFRHELQHVYQVLHNGWLKFYVRYLYRLIKHGYRNHPDELEAWGTQEVPLTKTERHFKDKTWYE